MSKHEIYHGTIRMEALPDGRRRLTAPFNCEIDGTRFTIPAGFEWDGASLPRGAWTLHGHPYDTAHLAPGLWHDAAYSGLFAEQGVTRSYADTIYRAWLIENGMRRAKAWVEYLAVRVFGVSHWQCDNTGMDEAAIVAAVAVVVMLAVLCCGCATKSAFVEGSGMYANAKTGIVGIGTMDIEAIPESVESAYIKYDEDTAWLSPSTKTHSVKVVLTGTNSTAKVEGVVKSICDAFKAAKETDAKTAAE